MGAFEKVFQANEPDALLGPVFLNHAHNDWLEAVITGGLPAAALLVIAVGGTLYAALRQPIADRRRHIAMFSQPDGPREIALAVAATESAAMHQHYARVGDTLPDALTDELHKLEKRLSH